MACETTIDISQRLSLIGVATLLMPQSQHDWFATKIRGVSLHYIADTTQILIEQVGMFNDSNELLGCAAEPLTAYRDLFNRLMMQGRHNHIIVAKSCDNGNLRFFRAQPEQQVLLEITLPFRPA